MGEAKRKLENIRKALLGELEKWSFPATEWERNAIKEILAMTSSSVTPFSHAQMLSMNMKPQQCHVNASEYARLDPEKKTEHLIGWWVQSERLILHSVVRRDGRLNCLTPSAFGHDESFQFIHDPRIEVQDEGVRKFMLRDGTRIGPGLRMDPETLMAKYASWKSRLLAGESPDKVVEWV